MRASPLLSVVFLTGCIPPPTPHAPPQLEDDGTPRTPGLATKVAAHPLWRAKVAEAQMEELVDQVRRTQPGGFVVVDDQFHTYTWRDITSLPVGGKPRIAACGSDRPLSLPDRIGDPFISIGGWDCCPARDVVLGTLLQCMNQVESKRAN